MSRGLITLITDFGLSDHFVGVMKGVIKTINPAVEIVDVCHDIPPHDIARAALMLSDSYRYFPPDTIHVVVVDPGVGSTREPVAVRAMEHVFVGPDNGVFTYIYEEAPEYRACGIRNRELMLRDVSSTFHGRDIFSPVAAHISKGLDLSELGPEIKKVAKLEVQRPLRRGDEIVGRVSYIDGFGNVVTNIPGEMIEGEARIEICGAVLVGVKSSYADVRRGEMLAIIGGSGYLEISANRARASDELRITDQARSGVEVVVKLLK